MRLSKFSRVKQVRSAAWYSRSWAQMSSKSPPASKSRFARRIKRIMAPAVALESMTQISFSGCSSSAMSRPRTAAL